LKYGEQYKIYIEYGADLSDSGYEVPEIEQENLDYWFAFWELNATRQIGLSEHLAISYLEILAYCLINQIDDIQYFQK